MSELNLRKVEPVRLFEQVVQRIRLLIVRGNLQPGDKLPGEMELSEALSVSRPSVREALRALESRGLIEVRSGTGAFVGSPRDSFRAASEAIEWLVGQRSWAIQLLQVREGLESVSASLAAASVTDELLTRLREIVEQQEQLSGSLSSLDRMVELDVLFHVLIAQTSENTIVEELVSSIVRAFCDSNRAVLYLDQGSMNKTLAEHRHIIEALDSRDPAAAEAAVRAHISRVRADVESVPPPDSTDKVQIEGEGAG